LKGAVSEVFQTYRFVGTEVSQSAQRLRYGMDYRGSVPGRVRDATSSLPHPNRIWGPFSLLKSGTGAPFWGVKGQGRESDTYLHPATRLRTRW